MTAVATDRRLGQMAARLLAEVGLFSRFVVGRALYPYQREPARALLKSVLERQGETFSVMMARQAGKNELSAHLEAYLLNLNADRGGEIVKAAPTDVPQLATSRLRLEWALENPLAAGRWRREPTGIRLGRARIQFLSAEPGADIVGATASLLLEVDEAQDIDPDKHDRDLAPIAASTNATRVYYGTAWREDDLLQRVKERNLELARRDGLRRHFEYPWDVVAEHNPEYARFVLAERARLGEDHPLFRTQYRLQTLGGEAGFLNARQRGLIRGDHPRQHAPVDGESYVAGIDLAGSDEEPADELVRPARPRRNSTVVTIARVVPVEIADGIVEPRLEVVEHCWWTGRGHRAQYQALIATLHDLWRCQRIAVDASGIGAGVAEFLCSALGEAVRPFVLTAGTKSKLGFAFLAAVNGGRFKMYRDPAAQGGEDGCAAEFWREVELCRYAVRRNRQLGFWVPGSQGRDDFVVSAALCAWAAREWVVPLPAVLTQRPLDFAEGRC
ncbi:MAG TPA: hypothetical protein VG370_34170 [Chloroflexota bacterium]|nr:hypothetical protein [Chloroflexota bacterium]